jgi:superfamily II DNA or RNA helicase
MRKLHSYQETGINTVSRMLAAGKRRVCFQLATGGGKTVIFSAICQRYIEKSNKAIIIVVHREELMTQARRTLYEWHNIVAEIVGKKMRTAKVYVAMVETLNNLMKRGKTFPDVGMIIVDEAHIGNHRKIYDYFTDKLIIGFTATPLSASKKNPINADFEDIVCGPSIGELIATKALTKNCTIDIEGSVNRKSLKVKNGEFDETEMGKEFSKAHNVDNTIHAYKEYAVGTKTLVFNVNIAHSLKVHEAFTAAGYNSRHLDASATPEVRKATLDWFRDTPDAILNSVGILTTGLDEPSVQTCIMNRATLSLSLWLQCCGRCSRIFEGKRYFLILDLGANAETFGDWDFDRDWKYIFTHPPKPGDGVAPIKMCPQCDCINHAAARECKGMYMSDTVDSDGMIQPTGSPCNYIFPEKVKVEMPVTFKFFTENINVSQIIEDNQHRKEYYPFFLIGSKLASRAKKDIPVLDDSIAEQILDHYHNKAKEWAHEKGKKYNQWHKDRAREHLSKELQRHFKQWRGWEISTIAQQPETTAA